MSALGAHRRLRPDAPPARGAPRAVRDRGSHDRQHPDRHQVRRRPRARASCRHTSIARRAYNGVCTALVTADGARHPPANGYVARGQAARVSRRRPSKASAVFPDLDQYQGLPLEYGRMETTVSDPSVMAADGHARRHPGCGPAERARDAQHPRRALGDLQGRVRRASVDRSAARRRARGLRRIPASSPTRWSARPSSTRSTARNPDLAALPMYCVVAAFKDPFDTKDMRTTSNSDVNFAMDVPPFDSTIVARLRAKGAIIYAKSSRARVQWRPGRSGRRRASRSTNWVAGGQTHERAGAARPATRTTPSACRADRAADPAWRSAPISRRSASASSPARRARARRRETASR